MILKKAGVSELQNGNFSDGIQTITGLRISAVDGTAFLDNCAELQKYAGRMIRIYDSGSRYLEGWIKANGTSESLDNEVMIDGGFDSSSGWYIGSGWTISGGQAFATSSTGNVLVRNTDSYTVAYGLYKVVTEVNSGSCTTYPWGSNGTIGTISVGTTTLYHINPLSWHIGFLGGIINIESVSVKKVLTPSATGLTIVSAQGGSTFNFTTKTTGFVYNAASYRYRIF